MKYTYPFQMVKAIRDVWKPFATWDPPLPALPDDERLSHFIEVAYHASFEREEQRPLRFAMVLIEPTDPGLTAKQAQWIAAPFQREISLTVSELRRLAPATDPRHTSLAVHAAPGSGKLAIWGLVHAGTSWHDFIRYKTWRSESIPPNALILRIAGPGVLHAERLIWPLCHLAGGELSVPTRRVLERGPVGEFFKLTAMEYTAEVRRKAEGELTSRDFNSMRTGDTPNRYLRFIERTLSFALDQGHGGAFLFVPEGLGLGDPTVTERVRVKYPLELEGCWPRIVDEAVTALRHKGLDARVRERTEVALVEYEETARMAEAAEVAARAALDAARFLGGLTSVDGAVLLTRRFRVLGFGAEVTAAAPGLSGLLNARDADGKDTVRRPLEEYGMRHRSVARFCASLDDSVGFVISQDGGVKAVRKVGPDVVVWPSMSID